MFKKSEPDLSKRPGSPSSLGAEAPSIGVARGSERNAPSVIGSGLTITGHLIAKGELQIDGEVQGNVRGTRVVIGERGWTTGDIVAEEIVVRGHVRGAVRGMLITLQSTGHVEGDIVHKALAIEHGAFFEGKSRRVDDPLADLPKPDIPTNGSVAPGLPCKTGPVGSGIAFVLRAIAFSKVPGGNNAKAVRVHSSGKHRPYYPVLNRSKRAHRVAR